MGDYSTSLSHEQWLLWVKRIKKWMIDNDFTIKDLAESIGYSKSTCVDALNQYDRCSRFLVAAINEKMESKAS